MHLAIAHDERWDWLATEETSTPTANNNHQQQATNTTSRLTSHREHHANTMMVRPCRTRRPRRRSTHSHSHPSAARVRVHARISTWQQRVGITALPVDTYSHHHTPPPNIAHGHAPAESPAAFDRWHNIQLPGYLTAAAAIIVRADVQRRRHS